MQTTSDPALAARALAVGNLAALPTETVYGLGARADLPRAIARLYATKGRPADHPLIVHVLHGSALEAWGAPIAGYARALAEAFWPGALTLVVPRTARAGDFITGGQDSVAVRVPAHPLMRSVLELLGALTDDDAVGVAAPSANRFGRVSPTTAAHVVDEFGGVLAEGDVVLDGGASDVGVESTIVDCTGAAPVILRPGQIDHDAVEHVTGLRVATASAVRAPGGMAAHYAPTARVLIVQDPADLVHTVDASTGLLALAAVPTPPGVVRLSAPADSAEYARVLYSALREADALKLARVMAVPPAPGGIGGAVIDRLNRAAAGS